MKKKKKYDYNTQPVLVSKEFHAKLIVEADKRGMNIGKLAERLMDKALTLENMELK